VKADRHTGKRIKELRVERRLSQREVAQGIPRVSYAYLSRIEAGKRTPSLSALIEIADKLDTSALYLATGSAKGLCPFCRKEH
jgi:transcriptional regulator with XRE-family HTH domain